jgi:hypothetical protein
MLAKEQSIVAGLAVASIVYATYSKATPTVADMRVGNRMNDDIESSRKVAAWTSAAVVAGVSLIAKDPNIFVMGGVMVIGLDWMTRHANAVDPQSGRASTLIRGGNLPVATQSNDSGAYGYANDIDESYMVS